MFLKILAGAVSALALASAANAAVNVSIWTDQAAASANATLAQAATLGAANGVTSVNAINFDSSNGYTVGAFLNSPAGLSATTFNHSLDNTYMYFTGQLFLNAGGNSFVVSHDDGLQLNIDGLGLVVNQPGPTAPVDTPFNVNAPTAGLYNFQLSYGECCGPPARLVFNINGTAVGGVPEPATWAMLLGGFGLAGAVTRRRVRTRVTYA